ncbi:DUF4913 domain-containing protein [Actinoplanes sp. NPDC049548]|uniref:DUF4913 domain-containing protein n=1 Tax=Actinoplanes sp. NPDC049548 TaxID=3155152 RepID=UPI00342B710F
MAPSAEFMAFVSGSGVDRPSPVPPVQQEGGSVGPPPPPGSAGAEGSEPAFILYHGGARYEEMLKSLADWVDNVLIPAYAREVTSGAMWCTQWWRHPEAVAHLHALFLAWQSMTGTDSDMDGAANWHGNHLGPVMGSLRDPSGPFAGCKPGRHRDQLPVPVDVLPAT